MYAKILLGISTSSIDERKKIHNHLSLNGYLVLDLTENDLANDHIRHLVGGYTEFSKGEQIISFLFPEKDGVLSDFLRKIPNSINITLFHYKNQGTEYGKILIGLKSVKNEQFNINEFLHKFGYPFTIETNNPAYQAYAITSNV